MCVFAQKKNNVSKSSSILEIFTFNTFCIILAVNSYSTSHRTSHNPPHRAEEKVTIRFESLSFVSGSKLTVIQINVCFRFALPSAIIPCKQYFIIVSSPKHVPLNMYTLAVHPYTYSIEVKRKKISAMANLSLNKNMLPWKLFPIH